MVEVALRTRMQKDEYGAWPVQHHTFCRLAVSAGVAQYSIVLRAHTLPVKLLPLLSPFVPFPMADARSITVFIHNSKKFYLILATITAAQIESVMLYEQQKVVPFHYKDPVLHGRA